MVIMAWQAFMHSMQASAHILQAGDISACFVHSSMHIVHMSMQACIMLIIPAMSPSM